MEDNLNYQLEMRRTLTDWVVGVFGILWSVWWGFFINKVIDANIAATQFNIPLLPSVIVSVPKWFFLTITAITLSVFAIVFVQWLWRIHETAYSGILLSEFLQVTKWLALMLFFLVSGYWATGTGYLVPSNLVWYGSVLTPLWPLTVLFTIWRVNLNE